MAAFFSDADLFTSGYSGSKLKYNPFEPHVDRLLAGVLGHFWRSQSGISVRNGSIGVDLLDRSILCRLFVFAGVVRTPIATQTCRTGVPELGYSPLPLLDGGEFILEVDCGEWDGCLWAVPKKRTSHWAIPFNKGTPPPYG